MKRRKGEQLSKGVVAEAILRTDFSAFAKACFSILHPDGTFMDNWHIHALAYHLEQVHVGKIRRLIVNMPPRSLKSMLCSVAFPAWVLGLEPGKRIICASYSADLAGRLSNEFRTVVNHKRYRRIFPGMRISDNKNTEMEITTTQHGFRLATSVGGTLTGRGGNIVVIDDPLKPQDAFSEAKRGLPNDWFDHTVLSRLDDKRRDAIVIVMQRLHTDDLTGKLLAAERHGWTVLNLPAIAERDERIPTGDGLYHRRRRGSLLHPEREPREVLDEMRARLGEANFQAQYQQNPMPAEGNLIKRQWVRRYKELPPRTSATYVIQSYDTASKEGASSSYSAGTTVHITEGKYSLVDVLRGRFDYPTLKAKVIAHAKKHTPDLILIEDAGVGTALITELRNARFTVLGVKPEHDKQTRMAIQSGKFEAGQVYLPQEAPWLRELEAELFAFPSARTDDQVDSISQALASPVSKYGSYDTSMNWVMG
jgi:predicted phage terminase large subunit-like protein